MGKRKSERPQLKLVGHYMIINGERFEIDPSKTDLPNRCKLALAEMATGKKYEFVNAMVTVGS
ncbi:hypothetical protein [Paenibacillus popilliae]|uniref:Uncharacterized protein n=1 Tax=Paenibacillus popilliae ATCC 14706 TaxID=1212764 RepID=M9LZH8_PAEPP|nr:hypothetical protein [Paenibacillus popilliae]GAC41689.1 hypothetical protein PPOP_1040 [Paenibacillus popilliae ATCC 14706]